MSRISAFLPIALIAASGASAAANAAQDEGSPQTSELQTVVVTAQRRSEKLENVPLAVTELSGSDLLAQGLVNLADYAATVPGLVLSSDGTGTGVIAIRGIVTGSGTTPSVGIYLDDTPIGASTIVGSGNNPALFDIDPGEIQRVEVLKGPQGTLYGSNSMGGVIRYISIAPNLATFSGYAQSDVSSVEHGGIGYSVRGAANLPLVQDELALRVSAVHRDDPGYIRNGERGIHGSVPDERRAARHLCAGGKHSSLYPAVFGTAVAQLRMVDRARVEDDSGRRCDVCG